MGLVFAVALGVLAVLQVDALEAKMGDASAPLSVFLDKLTPITLIIIVAMAAVSSILIALLMLSRR